MLDLTHPRSLILPDAAKRLGEALTAQRAMLESLRAQRVVLDAKIARREVRLARLGEALTKAETIGAR